MTTLGKTAAQTAIFTTDMAFRHEPLPEEASSKPYWVDTQITGVCPMLFHRYDCAEVERRSKAAKNSRDRKSDPVESYVYRCSDGTIGVPGAAVKGALVQAARYESDPRSKRKSASDLFRAGLSVMPEIASLGKETWDYLDQRPVQVQRGRITRVRPAVLEGWKLKYEILVHQPEYISPTWLYEVLVRAGRACGICDYRPDFGRFMATKFDVVEERVE